MSGTRKIEAQYLQGARLVKIKKKPVDNKDLVKSSYSFSANLGSQSRYSLSSQALVLSLKKNSRRQGQSQDGGLHCQDQDEAFETPTTRVNTTSFEKKSKDH